MHIHWTGNVIFLYAALCYFVGNLCLEFRQQKKKFAAVVYGNKKKSVEIILISAVAILMEKVCYYFIEAFPYKLKESK